MEDKGKKITDLPCNNRPDFDILCNCHHQRRTLLPVRKRNWNDGEKRGENKKNISHWTRLMAWFTTLIVTCIVRERERDWQTQNEILIGDSFHTQTIQNNNNLLHHSNKGISTLHWMWPKMLKWLTWESTKREIYRFHGVGLKKKETFFFWFINNSLPDKLTIRL